ncbi:UNVERIFIED_CONTAM: hypothetical protein NCL1_16812 [Trichonephila clavipes]
MRFVNTQGSATEFPKKYSTPINIGLDLDVYLNIPPNISDTTENHPVQDNCHEPRRTIKTYQV